MTCPFCNIKSKLILKENRYTYIIFSDPRLMPGHLLAIPKRHVGKLSELKIQERKELIDNIIECQEIILSKLASGCDIRQHFRPFQKQSRVKIYHMHFHLQPRELYDRLYKKCQIYETELFKNLPEKELAKIKKRFAK